MRSSRLPLGPTLYESVGALHMHSLYSDGTGTVPEIARFAGQKGLEWIIITDHEHLKAKKNGEEGWYGKTAVLVGSELGDEDLPNHYLAFGIDKVPDQSDPVRMVEEVHAMGGFGAIAHPHEKRHRVGNLPAYPWTAWDADIDGIEIWNQLSQWVEGLTPFNRFRRFLHPLKSLTHPQQETLSTWDRLNRKRPVIGYVGIDAHALDYPLPGGLFRVKVFHYKVQFMSLLTHLLLPMPVTRLPFPEVNRMILDALKKGRHFGANHRVGNPRGFRFFARVGDDWILPADSIPPGKRVDFHAFSPLEAELRLICDGRQILNVRGRSLSFSTTEPGIWRLEALRKGKGWIYTNPIRIVTE